MLSLQTLPTLLSHYGYVLLFLIAIVEGPIITVIAAFLASTGVFNIFLVYPIAVAGDFLGDGMWYWAARLGSKRFMSFVLRYGGRLGITEETIARAEVQLKNNFFKTIAVGKITDIVMLPIIIACGVLKVDYRKYAVSALVLDIPKDLFFALLGFYFGTYYLSINSLIDKFFAISTALLLVGLAIYFIRRYMRSAKY